MSKYHIHIERYMRVFPRDQVMVLLTEEMRRDPASAIKKAYEFIGVDSSYLPGNLGDRINASRLPKSRVAHRALDFLIAQRGRLESSPRLNILMTKVGRLFIKLNRSSIPSSDSWSKHRLALLTELDETIEYMEDFLGRPLDEWRK